MNELESYELAEIDNLSNLGEEEKKKFKVTNVQTASWVLRKIKFLNKKIEEINMLAEHDINKILEWKKRQTESYINTRTFFEELIKDHVREEIAIDNNFKLNTPYGTAYIKSNGDKWIYDDEALLRWAEKNENSLVNVTKSVKKAELKKIAAVIEGTAIDINSGEVIEGVTIEDGGESVIIRID